MLKPTFNNILIKIQAKKDTKILVDGDKNDSSINDLIIEDLGPEVHEQFKKGQKILPSATAKVSENKDYPGVLILADSDIIAIQ